MATQWDETLKSFREQIRRARAELDRVEEALDVAEGDTHPWVELAALTNANNGCQSVIAGLSMLQMSIEVSRAPLILWNNKGVPVLRLVASDGQTPE